MLKRYLRRCVLPALILLAALATTYAFAAEGEWYSTHTEDSGYVRTIVNAMQPLDAPGNPYAGQYSAWDDWAYANFRPGMDITGVGKEFEYPYDPQPDENGMVRQWMDFKLDSAGYMVPWSVWLKSWTDDSLRYGPGAGQLGPELATGFAIGMVDETLYARRQLAIEDARSDNRATAFPPIPAWLMQQEPLDVIFVPNGDICVLGPLGIVEAGMTHQQISDMKAHERWYRYSSAGELLEQGGIYSWSMADNAWMCFYWPELPQKIAEMQGQGYVARISNITVAFKLNDSRTLKHEAQSYFEKPVYKMPTAADYIAIYDYTGRELDLAEGSADMNDPIRNLIRMAWPGIGDYYKAQLSRGLTSEESVSAFEGQANGPQRVQGTYGPPVAVVPPNQDSRHPLPLLEVRPLDAPGNPYAGQYSVWDELCLSHASLRNEEQTAIFDSKRRALEQSVEEAKAAGLSMEQYIEEHPQADTGINEDEALEANIVWLSNYVDDNGFLVPIEVSGRTDQHDAPWGQYIRATVTLNDEQIQEYEEWKTTLVANADTVGEE